MADLPMNAVSFFCVVVGTVVVAFLVILLG